MGDGWRGEVLGLIVPPVGLQLYTVRDYLTKHYAGLMERIAGMGYLGVETSWSNHVSPRAAARIIRSFGLEVVSAYTHLPVGERKNEVFDMMAALGCKRIVASLSKTDVASPDSVKRACDLVNNASANAGRLDMQIGLHNHWWEFAQIIPGRMAYDEMIENLAPEVFFEVDTYWAQTAGVDPVELVLRLGKRAAILHLKDGPCIRGEPMAALGEGRLDFPAIMQAAQGATDWVLVELDACATDMLEAVDDSYNYLIDNGLARGRQT
jgi:sugar phosphate isomerase/epimerase